MKKALTTGFFTGITISVILIGGTYLRRFLPDTFTANLLFLILFFGSIVTAIWVSLSCFCKNSAVKLMSMNVTGVISSIIAALLVSIHGFLYSRFKDSGYLDEIMKFSRHGWENKSVSGDSFIGEWTWFQNPANYALYNFRDLMISLFLISIFITIIFYVRHRNRQPDPGNQKNHELIF